LADPHQAKAAYRFLANARVASSALVAGWQAATATRLADHTHVFVLHDTTTFSYTAQKQTTGLGWISHLAAARGFHCHTSLAVSADGVALGLVHQQYWSRPVKQMTRPQSRPMAEKESIKWLGGLEATATLLGGVPALRRPRVVHLMDREGDVHELFERVIALGHGAIIRRYRPRCVAEPPGDADAALRQSPVRARLKLHRPAGHGHAARTAIVETRSRQLTLQPQSHHPRQRQPLTITLVEVREIQPPPHVEPILWTLWTTEPARTRQQILAVTRAYALRWRIEDFHLVWKQGCRVEDLQLKTRQRLENALTLYAGVAVRLLQLRDRARRRPTAPCTEVLADEEWQALAAHLTGAVPATPPTLEQAAAWIGHLGGHLGRKADGRPGVRTLWRGWRDLAILTAGYRAARSVRR